MVLEVLPLAHSHQACIRAQGIQKKEGRYRLVGLPMIAIIHELTSINMS